MRTKNKKASQIRAQNSPSPCHVSFINHEHGFTKSLSKKTAKQDFCRIIYARSSNIQYLANQRQENLTFLNFFPRCRAFAIDFGHAWYSELLRGVVIFQIVFFQVDRRNTIIWKLLHVSKFLHIYFSSFLSFVKEFNFIGF